MVGAVTYTSSYFKIPVSVVSYGDSDTISNVLTDGDDVSVTFVASGGVGGFGGNFT